MNRFAALMVLLPSLALAAETTGEATTFDANAQQLETARAEVAAQFQLHAYELLDELVYQWTKQPAFLKDTPVVLADVRVPVGFGPGLQALIENHLTALLLKNPSTHLKLAHCPQCTSMVVRSGSKGTIVSRGVDEPEVLSQAAQGSQAQHALFLDFEAEGSALVLRARITSLEPALPIVFARTLTTSTTSPALLRSPEHLKSAEEARREYLDILENKSLFSVPLHLGIRTYPSNPESASSVMAPPMVWLQAGLEVAFSQARAWLANITAGVSWAPQLHVAVMGQARFERLITGSVSSITHPDVYAFIGGSIIYVQGQGSLVFRDDVPNIEELASQLQGIEPKSTFGTLQFGFDVRVKHRIGFGLFVEAMPGLVNSPSIGSYLNLGLIKIQSFGAEVTFCF